MVALVQADLTYKPKEPNFNTDVLAPLRRAQAQEAIAAKQAAAALAARQAVLAAQETAQQAPVVQPVQVTVPVVQTAPAPSQTVTDDVAAAQAYALSVVGPTEYACLYPLWERESGWNDRSVNPSSGAAGIAQSLGHGYVPLGDYVAQIQWGLNYIDSRYGDACAAMTHSNATGWY